MTPDSSYSSIKIKFYLSGFSGSDYIELDNIVITDNSITTHYDPNITFTITDSNNVAHRQALTVGGINSTTWSDDVKSARSGTATFTNGSSTVTGAGTNFTSDIEVGNKIRLGSAAVWYTVTNVNSSTSLTLSTPYTGTTASGSYFVFDGYYYACKMDVTDLVRNYSNGANLLATPTVYGNGNGTYAVGDMYSDTQSVQHSGKLADSGYGGWSLVIIYSSSASTGHYLCLYDKLRSVPNADGSNPYVISEPIGGFIVPEKITGETDSDDVAKLTIFVGEGDVGLYSTNNKEYVAFVPQGSSTEHVLWDGITCTYNSSTAAYNTLSANSSSSPYNVWNSQFIDQSTMSASTVTGIDVDTFHIKWGENLLSTGDTSATLHLSTQGDGYVLLYMIVSFRSETSTGGSLTYLIKG